MPLHICNVCGARHFYNNRDSEIHTCISCHRPFCKNSCKASVFFCTQCASTLPENLPGEIKKATKKYENNMAGSRVMSIIGGFLLPTTLLLLLINSGTSCSYCNPPRFPMPGMILWNILQPLVGISLLIAGAVLRYNSIGSMRQTTFNMVNAAKKNIPGYSLPPNLQPSTGIPSWPRGIPQPAQTYPAETYTTPPVPTQTYPYQPVVSNPPGIPQSAFVPALNEPPVAQPQRKGYRDYVEQQSVIQTSAAAPSPQTSSFCTACGEPIADTDSAYCPNCGNKLR